MPILLAFLAIPLLEIVLFVQLGGALGVLGTLLEIFASGALGVFLMRLEPYRNAADIRSALAQDRSPASPMAHSALRMIGALLLVIPGVFHRCAGPFAADPGGAGACPAPRGHPDPPGPTG